MFLGANWNGLCPTGYADERDRDIYFLKMNFTCSVFIRMDMKVPADFALKFDKAGQAGFLKHIID